MRKEQHDDRDFVANPADIDHVCLGCKRRIVGPIVWLGEDYRDEGGQIDGPYALHPTCANAPWPLVELTLAQALQWRERGNSLFQRQP